MKGVKKMISILVRIVSITRMKLFNLPKANKLDHFACKMGFRTDFTTRNYIYQNNIALQLELRKQLVYNYCAIIPWVLQLLHNHPPINTRN